MARVDGLAVERQNHDAHRVDVRMPPSACTLDYDRRLAK
jgi:hypothetical protein